MGGIGSGRKSGGPLITDYQTIDVRVLQRRGLLAPGTLIGANPLQKTGELPPLQLQVGEDWMILTLRKRTGSAKAVECHNHVRLERTPCNYGGSRPWFLCPFCGRRVALLYLADTGYFACRRCRKLAYRSQRETEHGRALSQVNTIRKRLGWPPGVIRGHGERPKEMHRTTFRRLTELHDLYAAVVFEGFSARCDELEGEIAALGESLKKS